MRASIVVCTLGGPKITRCLRSLQEQSYQDYEVLVMMENDLEHKIKDEKFKYHLTQNYNLSRTRNDGIKSSEGEFIAFIDDDAVADPRWLENLVKCYQEEHNVGCIGGKIELDLPDSLPSDAKEIPRDMLKGFLSATTIEGGRQELEQPRIWGCNMAFPASVFGEVGGFDPHLGRAPWNLKGEDEKDVQGRLLAEDYRLIWTPEAKVTHLIDQERLKENYFLRRALWQGYSEVIRKDKRQKWGHPGDELTSKSAFYELTEEMGEIASTTSLKRKIDSSRKLGRLSALLDFAEGKLGPNETKEGFKTAQ